MFTARFFKSILIYVCVIFSVPVSVQAQSDPYGQVSISSPTAASLGKYGDIPVSYSIGLPQISVPIYTVKQGALSLPISLSYHASGLKVMEPASWVGAGWSLNAGGVITRTVIGGPDERGTNSGHVEDKGHFSDYGYNSYIGGTGPPQDWQGFAEGRKDGEPDLFFFNFGGYSGKFYFRDDRTPILVPQQDIQITPNYTGTGSIQSFTLITPDGVQYFFGNSPGITGAAPIEITNPSTAVGGLSAGTAISSWYLNKISSPDGQDAISLTYQAESYGFHTLAMFPINGNSPASVSEYNVVKNIVQGVRLSQIVFTDGAVNFVPATAARTDLSDINPVALSTADNVNTQAKALASIQVTNGGSLCKNYVLSYGYFVDNTTPLPSSLTTTGYTIQTDRQRLRLDSVQEISCDNLTKIPAHKFSYVSGVSRRICFAQDHWGFYNGETTNQTLIPTYTVNDGANTTTASGADREPSWPDMLAGALYKITYPTGGYTQFDFEAHNTYSGNYTETLFTQIYYTWVGKMYGQADHFSQTGTFTSNGTAVVKWSNTTVYDGTLVVKNSSNVTVMNIVFRYGYTNQTEPVLPAGTYTITVTLPTTAQTGLGQVWVSQWVSTTSPRTLTVGGLRIKTITSTDGATSNNKVTSFSYLTGTQSTGILYSRPTYVQIVRNDMIKNIGYYTVANGFVQSGNGCTSVPNAEYYKSPTSIRPMATVQGGHIAYSQVTVAQAGNGYSIYHYYGPNPWETTYNDVATRSVTTQGCSSSAPNFPPAPLPFDNTRGELKFEEHYNQGGQLLKDVYYYPVYDNSPVLSTPGFIVTNLLGTPGVTKYLGTFYTQSTFRKIQMKAVATDYAPGVGGYTTTSITTIGSPWHNAPTSKKTVNSVGDTLQVKFKYANDFRVPAADAISDCSPAYTTACNNCSSTYTTASNACGGVSSCITTAYLAYTQCLTNARTSYVSCRRTNFTDPVNAFKTAHDNAKSSAGADWKPILELQDTYQNPLIETSGWRNTNLTGANFSKYEFSTNPVTAVYASKNQKVNLAAPSPTFTEAAVSGSNLTKDSRYSDMASVSMIKGTPVQEKSKGSPTISYLWDYNNTALAAKVTNASVDQIAYSSFEADSKGSWVYTGSATADATSPTGGKCYNLGQAGGTITRAVVSARSYRLTYWTKNVSAYSVPGTVTGSNKQGKTISGWTYFEHKITGVSAVSLTGAGYIDELRLYPDSSQMETCTYAPILGLTTQCDMDNRIAYFSYDALGRLNLVKDQDKNVLKSICYNYAGQSSECGTILTPNPGGSGTPVTITSSNYISYSGYTAVYTNTATSQQYTFNIPTAGGTVGSLLPATYNVTISRVGNPVSNIFSVCSGSTQSGVSVTFYNINVSATTCNNVTVDGF